MMPWKVFEGSSKGSHRLRELFSFFVDWEKETSQMNFCRVKSSADRQGVVETLYERKRFFDIFRALMWCTAPIENSQVMKLCHRKDFD